MKDVITKRINKKQARIVDDVRDYIGASSIGSECRRKIWYEYKGVKSEGVPPKTRRIWAMGKVLEGLVLDWIENAGIQVQRVNQRFNSQNVPFFQGHVDSLWIKKGKPYAILEIKTANDALFKQFVKKGLRDWDLGYYAQVQSYMGMSGIFSAYILVLNKDNSDISDEMVLFDPVFYKNLEAKAIAVASSVVEPDRIHRSPIWWQCKMCKFNKVCHK